MTYEEQMAAFLRGDSLEAPIAVAADEPNPMDGDPTPVIDADEPADVPADEPADVPADEPADVPADDVPADDAPAENPAPEETKIITVPKARLDEALRRADALQKQVNEANAKLAAAKGESDSASTLDALEDKFADAIQDGDKEAAKKIRAEIRAIERAEITAEMNHTKNTATAQVSLEQLFDSEVMAIETSYPEFKEGHELYNADISAHAGRLMAGFLSAGGYNAVSAAREAADTIAIKYGLVDRTAAVVTPEAPKPNVAAIRTAAAVKKAAATAAAQPPAASLAVGTAANKLNGALTADAVKAMPVNEFKALTEAQLAALRGDTV